MVRNFVCVKVPKDVFCFLCVLSENEIKTCENWKKNSVVKVTRDFVWRRKKVAQFGHEMWDTIERNPKRFGWENSKIKTLKEQLKILWELEKYIEDI